MVISITTCVVHVLMSLNPQKLQEVRKLRQAKTNYNYKLITYGLFIIY